MGLLERGIVFGTNTSPLPLLPADGTEVLISSVTITVTDATDAVRLMPSIWSGTSSSVVTGELRGNTIEYRIFRSDNTFIREVADTDFDELVTTFTAFDQPGVGTFTYNLFGRILRSTAPAQFERLNSVEFTAEDLNVLM